jgi:hypothetical protein
MIVAEKRFITMCDEYKNNLIKLYRLGDSAHRESSEEAYKKYEKHFIHVSGQEHVLETLFGGDMIIKLQEEAGDEYYKKFRQDK